MRSKEERDAARVKSLRVSAEAYALLAKGERDLVKRARLKMWRDTMTRRAEKLAQKMENK